MRISSGRLACVVAVAVAWASPAWAHGGRPVANPVGPILPGPTPDPYHPGPPGPTPPPTTPTPTPPTPPFTPGGPTPPGQGDTTGGAMPRRGGTQAGGSSWRAWWTANAGPFLQRPVGATRVTAESPLFRIGGNGGNRSDADRLDALAVEHEILPTLLWASEPTNRLDADTVASAYLALGKTARRASEVRVLLRAVRRRDLPELARESAALALGMLRRSDPAAAIDADVLDDVRETCLALHDDESLPVRTRAFAAFSIGLLGDQRSAKTSSVDRGGRWIVRELWARLLDARHPSEELPVALLVALSLQHREAVPTGVVDGLRTLVSSGRFDGRKRSALLGGQAAFALARVAPEDATGSLLALAHGRGSFDLRRAAVVALGSTAPHVAPCVRADASAALATLARGSGDPETRGLLLLSIGRFLSADLAEGSTAVVDRGAAQVLLDSARDAAAPLRPYAALALGLGLRGGVGLETSQAVVDVRRKALGLLREAVEADAYDPSARGAFCLGLGLARDPSGVDGLCAVASDPRHGDDLRADACAALGLVGKPTTRAIDVLRDALAERSSDELRRFAAVGLGLLGDRSAVSTLVNDLESGGSDHVLAQVVLGLGAIGDASSAAPLSRIVRDARASELLRAIACAGLGLLADREPSPSLSRLGIDSNYLAGTDALREALSLL